MANENDILAEAFDILSSASPTESPYKIKGSGNTLIDPDTVALSKPVTVGEQQFNRVRLPGLDALEVEHYTKDNKIINAELGGTQLHEDVLELVNKGGFNRVVTTEEVDNTGNRLLGDLENEQGETLSRKLLYHNLVAPNEYSTAEQVNTYLIGAVEGAIRRKQGTATEWDMAADNLRKNVSLSTPIVKPLATTEAEFASAPHLFRGVVNRSADRTLMNKARSTFDTALELGKLGVAEGAYGAMEMFGDLLNIDSLSDYGDAHQKRLQNEIQRLPVLENQSAFDEDGKWTLDGISEFGSYIFTNAVISAPYMLNTMIAGALAPVTMGASLMAPASVYAGQVYNEQDEDNKNAAAALMSGTAQAALDLMGLRIAGGAGNFLSKEGRAKVVKEVARKKKLSPEDAEAFVAQSFQSALKGLTKETRKTLAEDIAMKQALKGIGKAAAVGAVGEGVTESAQELLAMAGEMKDVDANEARSRLLNAVVAGATLGGGFGTAAATTDYMSVRNSVSKTFKTEAEGDRDTKYQNRIRLKKGKVQSIDEVIDDFNGQTQQLQTESLEEVAAPERGRRQEKGTVGNIVSYFKQGGPQALVQGFKGNILNKYIERGDIMRGLGSILGANKIHHGVDDEIALQTREASLNDILLEEEQAQQMFGVNGSKAVSEIMYNDTVQKFLETAMRVRQGANYASLAEAVKANGLRLEGPHAKHLDAILNFGDRLYNLDIAKDQKIGTSLTDRVINKSYLEKNIDEFKTLLVEKKGVDPEAAERIANDIRDLNYVEKPEQAVDDMLVDFDDLGVDYNVESLQDDPDFAKFYDDNIFYNIFTSNASHAARYVNDKYFGRGGTKIAGMLKLAKDNGEISQAEMEFLAAELADYQKMKNNQYGRIQNEFVRKTLQNGLFITTLNQLPLATLASLVELGLSTRMLTRDQAFKLIAPSTKALALEMNNYMNELSSKSGLTQRKSYLEGSREMLKPTGYLLQSQNARVRSGAMDASGKRNNLMNAFFKLIGLQGFTNFTRTIRLAISGDYIMEQVETLVELDANTLGALEARENLVRLGVDIDFLKKAYTTPGPMTKPDMDYLNTQMLNGSIAFTDLAVAHPRVGNRPKFYSDPRLSMLMAFQGFIATFTSTILPQIYRGLAGRTIGARMESVKTIALLIAFGFLAQYLRDLVKYGEAPEWLDDEQKFQRAIYSSGLLGTGERVYDMFDPLYPQRSTGAVDSVGNFLEGEIPAVSYGARIVDTVGKALDGDYGAAAKGAVKSAPLIGPLHQVAVSVQEQTDKALKGEY